MLDSTAMKSSTLNLSILLEGLCILEAIDGTNKNLEIESSRLEERKYWNEERDDGC